MWADQTVRVQPTDAERARTLVSAAGHASLSTLDENGFPFGSLVAHAVDDIGRPILLLADLAAHSRNLAADPRASLLIPEEGSGDPLDLGRVTLVGELAEPPEGERAAALATYRARHDGTLGTDHGFRILRLEVGPVRFVGGFARMSWVGTDDYRTAEPDPLTSHVARIVEHMNDDHADALVTFCRVLGERPDTGSATMTSVDRYGFDVLPDVGAPLRLPFPRRVDTPDEVRAAMVDMVRAARSSES